MGRRDKGQSRSKTFQSQKEEFLKIFFVFHLKLILSNKRFSKGEAFKEYLLFIKKKLLKNMLIF